jgi:hypothetical protein
MVLEDLIGQFLYKSGDQEMLTQCGRRTCSNATPAPDANTAPQAGCALSQRILNKRGKLHV